MAGNFSAAQLQALMAAAGAATAPPPLLQFKAGILTQSIKTDATTNQSKCMVTADPRRGTVKLSSQEGVLHLQWFLRPSDTRELDLILFKDSCTFERVTDCTDGRVYLLKFNDGQARHWFWMQEPEASKDKEVEEKFRELLKKDFSAHPGQSGRRPAAISTSTASASSTNAAPTAASTSTAPAPAASTTTSSTASTATSVSAPAAATPAVAPQDANALARALAAMQSAQEANQPRHHLNDVIDAERVLAVLDPADIEQLVSELPEGDRDPSNIGSHLRSAQFHQTVQRLNNLLHGTNYGSLMSSLGLPVDGFGVEGLVQALQNRADRQRAAAQAPSTPNQPTQPQNKEPERK